MKAKPHILIVFVKVNRFNKIIDVSNWKRERSRKIKRVSLVTKSSKRSAIAR